MGATLIIPSAIEKDLTATNEALNNWLLRFVSYGMIRVRGPVGQLRGILSLQGQRADQLTASQVVTLEAAFPDEVDMLVNNTNGLNGRHLGIPEGFDVPMGALNKLLNAGGEIVSLPLWVRLTNAQHAQQVPTNVGMRDTAVLDQDGQPTGGTKLWSEWGDVDHVQLVDGGVQRWYVPLHTSTTPELASVAKALSVAGATIVTASEIQAIQAAQ